MADPFTRETRVLVACTHCRESKIKCMAHPEKKPCMRCERKGLHCEYISTAKQRSRGTGSKTPQPSNPPTPSQPTTPFPPPSPNQTLNFDGYAQTASYGGYMPPIPPTMGGNPYGDNPNVGSGSLYRPPSQRNNTYSSVPGYQVPSQTHGPATPYAGSMQYPGPAPSQQQPMNPNYPIDYGNYTYNYNASSQPL
ncbi:hypothetical protein B0H19DRAFT_1067052 [Mycena capillaripes]|nr:hypothetical protein B0H19DRAFT_1067052 [Mycena capillaripes]